MSTSFHGVGAVVAVDMGGTCTRVGLFARPEASSTFTPLDNFLTATRYEEQLDRIAGVARAEIDADPASAAPVAIGVSVGARLRCDGRVVAVAPNLRDFEGQPFADDLAARCGAPVWMAHDPVCGALAERRFGVLRSEERCAYVTVSTGTGGAISLGVDGDGRTISIEFGHQLLAGETRVCACGQIGCLETYTGGRQLEMRYGRPLEEIDDAAVWDALYDRLALGLVNLAQLSRVEVVAVSGAITLGHEGFLPALRECVEARLRGVSLRLEMAELGGDAPLVGAALLPTTPDRAILH